MSLLDPLAGRGPARARNRVVFGPHETNLGRRRALVRPPRRLLPAPGRGGAGVIVVEEASVHPSDWPYERGPLASDCAEGWAAIAAAVPARDGRAWCWPRSGHAGGQGRAPTARRRCGRRRGCPRSTPARCPSGWRPPTSPRSSPASAPPPGGRRGGLRRRGGQRRPAQPGAPVPVGPDQPARRRVGRRRCASPARCSAAVRGGRRRRGVVGLRLSCDELAPWAGITPEAAAEVAARPGRPWSTTSRSCGARSTRPRPPGPTATCARLQPRPGPPGRAPRVGRGRPWWPRARSSTSAMAERALVEGACDAWR